MRPQLIRNGVIGVGLGIVTLVIICIIFFFTYYLRFLSASQLNTTKVFTIAKKALSTYQKDTSTKTPILLLGLDNRNDEFENTLLTDAVILATVSTTDKRITTTSLPRDLWIASLQTKINALYFYGTKENPKDPTRYVIEKLHEITGVNPKYYFIINYAKLPELIDHLGGITVNNPNSFIDNNFPNPAYIEGSKDQPKYITVSFEKGEQIMDGKNALMFVRSRGSDDKTEGSDTARSIRQSIFFQAIISRISDRQVALDPVKMGKLYRFYRDTVQTNATDSDLLSLMLKLKNPSIKIESKQITDLLTTPPLTKYGLWVFEPRDPSWKELKEFFREQ